MPKKILLFFVPIFLFAVVGQAFAHAMPTSYEPENSSIVAKTPGRVRIGFSETVDPRASSITVFAPDGSRVDNGHATTDSGDAHFFSTAIKDGGQGTYTVSWQVVSAEDGHFTKGAFVFSVGRPTAAAGPGNQNMANMPGMHMANMTMVQYSSSLQESSTIWLELLGQSIIFGGLLLFAFAWRPAARNFGLPDDKRLQKKFSFLIFFGSGLTIAGAIAYLALKSFDLEQAKNIPITQAFKIFAGTLAGSYTLYRTILAALFAGLFWLRRKKIFSSSHVCYEEVVLMVLALLMEYARARVSHSAAQPFYPSLSVFITFVQLAGKDLWVGGVILMALVFAPALRANSGLANAFRARFSKIIAVILGVAGVSGVYMVWLDLKGFSNLFTSDWGVHFIWLAAFAGVLLGLRLYQQVIVDKTAVSLPVTNGSKKSERRLTFSYHLLKAEAAVGVAVLFVTSILIITTPPEPPKASFEQTVMDRDVHITLAEDRLDPNAFALSFKNMNTGNPVNVQHVIVAATNNEQDIGPVSVPTKQTADGSYTFPESMLSPAGVWKISVTGQRNGAYDAVANFDINYPNQLEQSQTARHFGTFEATLVMVALLIAGFAIMLFLYSRNLGL